MTVFTVPDDGSGGAPGPAGPPGLSGSTAESRAQLYKPLTPVINVPLAAGFLLKLPVFTVENPDSSDVTPSAANDELVVHKEGVYGISFSICVGASATVQPIIVSPAVNGVAVPESQIQFGTLLGITLPGAGHAYGVAAIPRGAVVDLRALAGVNLTLNVGDVSLMLRRIRD